jgi:hypothetical protein
MKNYRSQFLIPVIVLMILSLAFVLTACASIPGNFVFGDDSSNQVPEANNPSNQLPGANNPSNQIPEANNPSNQVPEANNPSNQQAEPEGFLKTDCNVSGVTFSNINVGYTVTDVYDGPNLVCSLSTTGLHGLSESVYFRIVAYKAGPLLEFYQDLQKNIKGFVDQANEWNAQPDLPPEVKDEITFIHDDSDGYIFMITKEANIQKCINGDGYGVENVDGKYLVEYQFSSCEGDAGAYITTIQNLQNAARAAIRRVEASTQP